MPMPGGIATTRPRAKISRWAPTRRPTDGRQCMPPTGLPSRAAGPSDPGWKRGPRPIGTGPPGTAVRASPPCPAPHPATSMAPRMQQRRAKHASAATRCGLEDRRLGVGTEDGLERLDDLALGGVRAGGVEQVGHQVLPIEGGRLAQLREGSLDRGAHAPGPRRLETVDLLALEPGVDAQDRQRRLVVYLVGVDADLDALARVDLVLVAEGSVGDLAL